MLQMAGAISDLFSLFPPTVPAFDDFTDGCIADIRHRCWCGLNWMFTVAVVSMPRVCHIRT